MSKVTDMAKDLGHALARTDEYKALQRAISNLDDDREVTELRNELQEAEQKVARALRQGEEPDDELKEEYEELASKLQSKPGYQRLVAAQSNFDKVLKRVNETISEALEEGKESRIVMPS